ncbi:MAG: XrtA system polysaccharide chain length determinant [Pseudomonadota bacterium]
MNEQIQLARRYARMLWRYRWGAMGLATVFSVLGWIYVLTIPNSYEANAKMFVDTRSMLRPLMEGLAVSDTSQIDHSSLMKRTLLTRPNLEAVARAVDLDLEAETDRDFEAIVNAMAERVDFIGSRSGDNVYEIYYDDIDPERAKKVVDELLNTFFEMNLSNSRTDTEVTQDFIDAQLEEYESRLVAAEDALKVFKQEHVGLMPGSGPGYFSRLEEARAALKDGQLALQEATNARDALQAKLSQPKSETGEEEEPVVDADFLDRSQYTPRIKALQEKLDEARLQFTEKHPDIIALVKSLAELDAQREEELATLAGTLEQTPLPMPGNVMDPYAQIRLALAERQAIVAALETRVAEFTSRVGELEGLVRVAPEIEAKFARLNRDYGLNKQRYEELLLRRETARLSKEVEKQSEDVKLRVIEPPIIPLVPSGPPRALMFLAVFGASLGLGGAVAYLLSQLKPRFYSEEEVKDFIGVPVLGVVSYVSTGSYRAEKRMELAVFSLTLVVLGTVCIGLVAAEFLNLQLHDKVAAAFQPRA